MLLLLGMARSKRPASDEHPFGVALRLYSSAFVVAILIFGLGARFSAYEDLNKLANPRPITEARVNYVVLSVAMVIEDAVWLYTYRKFPLPPGEGTSDPLHRQSGFGSRIDLRFPISETVARTVAFSGRGSKKLARKGAKCTGPFGAIPKARRIRWCASALACRRRSGAQRDGRRR